MDPKAEYLAACEKEYEAMEYARTKGLNFSELEGMAVRAGKRLSVKLLESRLAEDPRADPEGDYTCPRCQGSLRIQEGAQERKIRTVVGEVRYRRPYGVCDRCQKPWIPLDQALGLPSTGASIGHRERVCHAAVVGRSFDVAHEVLEVHAGLLVSPKHVRTVAEGEGRRIVEETRARVRVYQEGKLDVSSSEKPALMIVTCDGGRVQTREEGEDRWKEDKIGCVYDATPGPEPSALPDKYEGAKAGTKTYVATMERWEEMGWMLRVEAEARGWEKAQERMFVSDGAPVLRELKKLHFPEAQFVLDWPHAVEHLMASAKAAFGEGTAEAGQWYREVKQKLWDGKVDEVIEEIREHSDRVGAPREGDSDSHARVVLYRNATSYFPNNREGLDYPRFRSKGWPIGSGVAEGAVKQFALRVKGSEKFWNISGAEEMLALCALYHSEDGRWRRHWRGRAQPDER